MEPDLYTSWLGIPAAKRPPSFYTLLGVERFCSDIDEIEKAVRRQMDRLDQYALHPDKAKRDACQDLMNDLAKAQKALSTNGSSRRKQPGRRPVHAR